jgi:hypothetical protein
MPHHYEVKLGPHLKLWVEVGKDPVRFTIFLGNEKVEFEYLPKGEKRSSVKIPPGLKRSIETPASRKTGQKVFKLESPSGGETISFMDPEGEDPMVPEP